MIKAVFFDLDGTVTNSQAGIVNAVNYAIEQLELQKLSEKTLNLFIGPPLFQAFQDYCHLDDETTLKAVQKYREYYAKQGLFENEVYAGMTEALQTLQRNYHLYIATAKPEVYAQQIIDHFELDQYFEKVFGATLDQSRTSKIDIIKYGLDQLNLFKPAEVVMVGDRPSDITGGQVNGLTTIGVTYGFGTKQELQEAKPTQLIEGTGELPRAVDDINRMKANE
jgi:phosphoglycolate phosphatase